MSPHDASAGSACPRTKTRSSPGARVSPHAGVALCVGCGMPWGSDMGASAVPFLRTPYLSRGCHLPPSRRRTQAYASPSLQRGPSPSDCSAFPMLRIPPPSGCRLSRGCRLSLLYVQPQLSHSHSLCGPHGSAAFSLRRAREVTLCISPQRSPSRSKRKTWLRVVNPAL